MRVISGCRVAAVLVMVVSSFCSVVVVVTAETITTTDPSSSSSSTNRTADTNSNTMTPAGVFGTDHGYDRGGPDPVCWRSRFAAGDSFVLSNDNANNNNKNETTTTPIVVNSSRSTPIVIGSTSSAAATGWNKLWSDSIAAEPQQHPPPTAARGDDDTAAAATPPIELLDHCIAGTQLVVVVGPIFDPNVKKVVASSPSQSRRRPLDAQQQHDDDNAHDETAVIFTGSINTFTIQLNVVQNTNAASTTSTGAVTNTSTTTTSMGNSTAGPSTTTTTQLPLPVAVFVRLQLCDALQFGFCNPISQIMNDNNKVDNDDEQVQVQETTDRRSDSQQKGAVEETEGQQRRIILSEWTTIQLLDDPDDDGNEEAIWHGQTSLSLHLPTLTTRPGPYHVIAHAFMVEAVVEMAEHHHQQDGDGSTSNVTKSNNRNGTLFSRWDIAAPIPGHVVVMVQHPPILLEVTRTTKIVMGTAMGLCGAFALALVVFCCVRRHHAAMRLAQGNFLTAMSLGCLVQILGSCALFPTRDVYCRTFGVLGLLPMTFVAACLVGRIWRVYRTLANVHQLGRHRRLPLPQQHHQEQQEQLKRRQSLANATGDSVVSALTSIANLPNMSPFASPAMNEGRRRRQRQLVGGRGGGCQRGDTVSRRRQNHQRPSAPGGFRQSVTTRETACLVVALTLPQLLLQVLAATLDDRRLVIDTDSTGTFQRLACDRDGRWASMVGTVYVAIVCMLAVILAWVSRDLPSAFNEKDQVDRAASVCIFTTFIGIAMWGHLNDPATHPDLAVILQGGWSLLVPMSVLTMIVFPKVQRVLSGEKVVVSNMVGGRFSIDQQSGPEASWRRAQHPGTSVDTTSTGCPLPTPLSRKISLGVDDPLPQELEGLLFNVQTVLRGVTTKIAQGRAPTQLDLTRLGEEVALLSDELAVVDFVNALQLSNTKKTRARIKVPSLDVKEEQAGSDDQCTLQSSNSRKIPFVPSLDENEEEDQATEK